MDLQIAGAIQVYHLSSLPDFGAQTVGAKGNKITYCFSPEPESVSATSTFHEIVFPFTDSLVLKLQN